MALRVGSLVLPSPSPGSPSLWSLSPASLSACERPGHMALIAGFLASPARRRPEWSYRCGRRLAGAQMARGAWVGGGCGPGPSPAPPNAY